MRISILLSSLLLLAVGKVGFSQAPDFKIYATEPGREIDLSSLADLAGNADVLFFGEQHNDSVAHWLQDTIYTLLLERYGTVTLSLEMFETDCQQVVDEYLQDYITEETFISDARAWNNYTDAYRPLVETAKSRGQAVVAANAPRRYVNVVSRKGLDALAELPKSAQQYLAKLPINSVDSAYYARFQEAMGGGGHGMGDNFYHAQCTWDATMAQRIHQHWRSEKPDLVFHLNGSFHTDYQQGTITQLRRLSRKVKPINISCFPVADFETPDWSAYSERGDFIIISKQ